MNILPDFNPLIIMESKLSPSEVFIDNVVQLVNKEDVAVMVEAQKNMLLRFEKTNEMLQNFNALSVSRYEASCQEFKKHTILLNELKKDLDSVFRRIRVMKEKLGKQYPGAFSVCGDVYNVLEQEETQEPAAAAAESGVQTLPTIPSETSVDTLVLQNDGSGNGSENSLEISQEYTKTKDRTEAPGSES